MDLKLKEMGAYRIATANPFWNTVQDFPIMPYSKAKACAEAGRINLFKQANRSAPALVLQMATPSSFPS